MTQLDIALMYSRNRTSNPDLLEVETFLDESRVVLTSFYLQLVLARALILFLTSQGLILRMYSVYQPLLRNLSFYTGLIFLMSETVLSLSSDSVRGLDGEIKAHIVRLRKSRKLYLKEQKRYYKHLKSIRGGATPRLKSMSIKKN